MEYPPAVIAAANCEALSTTLPSEEAMKSYPDKGLKEPVRDFANTVAQTVQDHFAPKPEPTPTSGTTDPDFVLAREAAAQEEDARRHFTIAANIRQGLCDHLAGVQSALRALKLKEQG